MIKLLFSIIFTLISVYYLIKAIYYGIYEITQENNKKGGITIITFSTLVSLFTTTMVWIFK